MAQRRALEIGRKERREEVRVLKKAQGKVKQKQQCPHFCHQVICVAGPFRLCLHMFPERPLPFLSFAQSYSTLLPGLSGGQLACGGRRTWESHPSEDLSELHRCFGCIAMQKYHYRQMRSWRDSLPRLLLDERVSLGTFRFGACIDTGYSRAGGHGAFSASLSSVQEAHLLM